MVMPRLGGAGLLTALRRCGLNMPVILMSGHPLGEDITALEQLGMAAWLDKPPGGLQVARAIADALGCER
jgi:FixJ family two-component response regulator